MKNKIKLMGIIALIAVIGFLVFACGNNNLSGTYVYNDRAITFNDNKFDIDGWISGTYTISGDLLTLKITEGFAFWITGPWSIVSETTIKDNDEDLWIKQ